MSARLAQAVDELAPTPTPRFFAGSGTAEDVSRSSAPNVGDFWIDTSTSTLFVYTGAERGWIETATNANDDAYGILEGEGDKHLAKLSVTTKKKPHRTVEDPNRVIYLDGLDGGEVL